LNLSSKDLDNLAPGVVDPVILSESLIRSNNLANNDDDDD